MKKNLNCSRILSILIIAVTALLLIYMSISRQVAPPEPSEIPVLSSSPPPKPSPSPSPSPEVSEEPTPEPTPDETASWPTDKVFITASRKAYSDGELRLVIPKMAVDGDVWNGTDEAQLKKGACLYDYAQLPGTGANRNVSIAGHRDGYHVTGRLKDGIFYSVHELADGDYLYLSDAENIYRYEYYDTRIVENDDWSVIYLQGFNCLTLTSCDPIGTSEKRIIIRAELDKTFEFSDDFEYLSSAADLSPDGE